MDMNENIVFADLTRDNLPTADQGEGRRMRMDRKEYREEESWSIKRGGGIGELRARGCRRRKRRGGGPERGGGEERKGRGVGVGGGA